jgi:hypothetical protein
MKIYLAARYSRRDELAKYRDELIGLGHVVTSRWLDGPNQRRLDNGLLLGEAEEALIEAGLNGRDLMSPEAIELAGICGIADLNDVLEADVMVTFTEGGGGRGGRHVEWGVAANQGLDLIIVGPREHVFHCLPDIKVYSTWEACRKDEFEEVDDCAGCPICEGGDGSACMSHFV